MTKVPTSGSLFEHNYGMEVMVKDGTIEEIRGWNPWGAKDPISGFPALRSFLCRVKKV